MKEQAHKVKLGVKDNAKDSGLDLKVSKSAGEMTQNWQRQSRLV